MLQKKLYRQGDLAFIRQSEQLSGTQEPIKDGILAQGEATGHAHRIARDDLVHGRAKVFAAGEPRRLFVEAIEAVRVVHEEHDPITLSPGLWEVRRQREYTPQQERYVSD